MCDEPRIYDASNQTKCFVNLDFLYLFFFMFDVHKILLVPEGKHTIFSLNKCVTSLNVISYCNSHFYLKWKNM